MSLAPCLFLTGKAFLQPFHAPILLELPQRAGAEHGPRLIVHIPQPRPQLRVMDSQLPQFVNPLQRAAPAGGAAVNLVQPAKIKAPAITNLQRLGFGDFPLYQGIAVLRIVFTAVGFIGGDANMVQGIPLFLS